MPTARDPSFPLRNFAPSFSSSRSRLPLLPHPCPALPTRLPYSLTLEFRWHPCNRYRDSQGGGQEIAKGENKSKQERKGRGGGRGRGWEGGREGGRGMGVGKGSGKGGNGEGERYKTRHELAKLVYIHVHHIEI